MEKKDISRPLYDKIHKWLIKNFGKACKCEHCNRPDKKRYHWALRKGFVYDFKRENFIELCSSCHLKYDYTDQRRQKVKAAVTKRGVSEETKEKISRSQLGKTLSESVKEKISISLKGRSVGKVERPILMQKDGEQKFFSSITAAANKLNLSISGITNALKGRSKTCGGYIPKYINKN